MQGGAGMVVLLVDDEESYRSILRDILTARGWEVVQARNGQEALQKIKDFPVDIVVSDIYMPVMDGLKLNSALHADPTYAQMPFLFISGYDDGYTAGAVRNPRIEGFYRKGAPISQLLKWIEFLSTPEKKRGKLRPDGDSVSPSVGFGTPVN
jgi:CheY-like chemotaxis protein